MTEFFKKLFGINQPTSQKEGIKHDRNALQHKVEKGTDRAIKEYRQAFEKLAEYDRQS